MPDVRFQRKTTCGQSIRTAHRLKVSLDIFAKYAKLHDMTEIRILKVPEDLKRALKVRAAAEDKGLNDLILEILIASVEKANSKGAR